MIIIDCVSPCKECVDDGSKCTSCESSSLTPFLYNNICYDECPAGTYEASPGICESNNLCAFYLYKLLALQCTAPCVTCTGTATTCTSCPSSQFLYQNDCHPSCPQGSYQVAASTCEGSHCVTLQYLYI